LSFQILPQKLHALFFSTFYSTMNT
jgi:hypothetical protein